MSYIITVTIPTNDAMNHAHGIDALLLDPLIRFLSRDHENDTITLDIRGDFDDNAHQVRWLCNKLVDAGILRFQIGHSY